MNDNRIKCIITGESESESEGEINSRNIIIQTYSMLKDFHCVYLNLHHAKGIWNVSSVFSMIR